MPIDNAFGPMTPDSSPPFHEVRLDGQSPMLLVPQTASASRGKALHTHPEGQFYFALHGLIVIETSSGRSVMPPGRLGWIPPSTPHGASIMGSRLPEAADKLVGFTMYLLPELCTRFPVEPLVLGMNPMLDAILARMRHWPRQRA